MTAEAAEAMKQTPMYEMYSRLAPRIEDWPRLLRKIGESMALDFDFTKDVAKIKSPTLIVAGDADIFPPAHTVEVFRLLGGGKQDPGWDGSGSPEVAAGHPAGRVALHDGHRASACADGARVPRRAGTAGPVIAPW